MRHQIVQRDKFCSNKYLRIENQVQEEEEAMRKVFNLIHCSVVINFKRERTMFS